MFAASLLATLVLLTWSLRGLRLQILIMGRVGIRTKDLESGCDGALTVIYASDDHVSLVRANVFSILFVAKRDAFHDLSDQRLRSIIGLR
jgi:hypothetical protein